MKNFIHLCLFVCVIALTFVSCSGDDAAPKPELTLSVEQLTFSKNGESKFFYIKASTAWQVSSSESWCSLTPVNGESGTVKVIVTPTKNETAALRSAVITAVVGSLTKQIAVTQGASGLLSVEQSEYAVGVEGDNITMGVQSSATYTIQIDASWITATDGAATSAPKFKVDSNPGLLARSGTITFLSGGITALVTINQSGNPLNISDDDTGMDNDAMALSQKMGPGWNLGNSLEATSVTNGVYTASETLWGNAKTSKTLIDAVKAAGFNTVRLPCAWSGYLENETDYRIKDSWLARIKEVADYCIDNDMYVIINIHWDGGWLENNPTYAKQDDINKKQKALWEQIGVYFRDYDEHLLFAGTNEVHADYGNPKPENIEVQQSFNQTFVNAVRSTGGRNAWRNLIVQAYNTNISLANTNMTMPSEPNAIANRLMAEVHFYDPYDFALDETSSIYLWGAAYAGTAHTSTWGQEAWVDEAFGMMKTKFIDKGIPVILGEYGATLRSALPNGLADHIKARNYYLNYVSKTAKSNGMVPVYWDNGSTGNNGSGLFDRATGDQAHSDAIDAIISPYK